MNRLRLLHPLWIAAFIALAAVLWMLSGVPGGNATNGNADRAGQAAIEKTEPLVEVRVRMSHARPVTRMAEVAGRTAAVRKVKLRTQIGGRVVALEAQRGTDVAAGEVIVRLDSGDLEAQLAQAETLLQQRRLQYQAAREMAAKGYQSAVGLATAKTHLQQARTSVTQIRTQIDYTTIEAPFAGVLETLPVELGDVVSMADVVGQVIQQDPFIVWGQVTEDVVAELQPGQPGTATLISGVERRGHVRFISSVADKDTRTYRVELEIDPPAGAPALIAGASAQLRLPLQQVMAHRVETAILTLDADGVFGIKAVDDRGIVHFYEADIVRSDDGHVWLAGMPASLRIITVGQGFVRAGDKVVAKPENKMPAAAAGNGGNARPES